MTATSNEENQYVAAIRKADYLLQSDRGRRPKLWIPTHGESILNNGLSSISLADLPLRTRSKMLKGHVHF